MEQIVYNNESKNGTRFYIKEIKNSESQREYEFDGDSLFVIHTGITTVNGTPEYPFSMEDTMEMMSCILLNKKKEEPFLKYYNSFLRKLEEVKKNWYSTKGEEE